MDGIVFKVRENPKVINKTIYLTSGLNWDGKKEALAMWLDKDESVKFLLGVPTYLQAWGVKDTLITANDNINGLTQTIKNVFPESQTQICVVHQIRNSARTSTIHSCLISYLNNKNASFTSFSVIVTPTSNINNFSIFRVNISL